MIRKILHRIADRLPCRIISAQPGEPYLERYYVATLFGRSIYLHHFVESDPARGLHDHPWAKAFSVVLAGWYYEQTRTGLRKVRWFNRLSGDTFHRVILPRDWSTNGRLGADGHKVYERSDKAQSCWTLFVHSAERVKAWGFLKPMTGDPSIVWVPWNYPANGAASSGEWWKTAPLGRNTDGRVRA